MNIFAVMKVVFLLFFLVPFLSACQPESATTTTTTTTTIAATKSTTTTTTTKPTTTTTTTITTTTTATTTTTTTTTATTTTTTSWPYFGVKLSCVCLGKNPMIWGQKMVQNCEKKIHNKWAKNWYLHPCRPCQNGEIPPLIGPDCSFSAF